MKVDSKIFKGIEYVQVSELPQAQREILTQTINPDLFIKLLVDGKLSAVVFNTKITTHGIRIIINRKLILRVNRLLLRI